jgi:beta-mannosidase
MLSSLSLSSQKWQFRNLSPRGAWHGATVPGCVHTDLLSNKLIPDPFFGTNELDLQWIENCDWEYRCRFKLPAAQLDNEHLDLVADGLDTVATVILNGMEVAKTENMFSAFRWPVRSLLKAGNNELVIRFDSALKYIKNTRTDWTPPKQFSDPVGGSTRIRKQACQFGWDWGPRFVTSGIWRDIRIEGWNELRLSNIAITQKHSEGKVSLLVKPELDERSLAHAALLKLELELDGKVVASAQNGFELGLQLDVPEPELWWPAGQGGQTLYTIRASALTRDGDKPFNTVTKRIGLRTMELDRHADEWGESFQFKVNGRPVFAKGANWVPANSFVAGLQRKDYERDLKAAVAANMNMIRLWGGGIYEHESFYDLCDELGLMIWHDFMFACNLYPSDEAYCTLVRQELETQIPRLRHHASLALWCGNNELCQINKDPLEDPKYREGYEKLFHTLIPAVISQLDPASAYWPTSEWRGRFNTSLDEGEKRGDTHYWEVWHARKPVKDYERYALRFCSEFGMQSYSSPHTLRAICPADDSNLFGRTLENHQKNPFGNQIILDYVSRRYGLPRDQEALLHLSQLNHAYCMEIAVEHYRRISPRCMGALYWQINDCWPVASWSSIEHDGRWKAIHYAAKRFFAPALVSAHIPGDETQNPIGNYRLSNFRDAHIHTVYDAPKPAKGMMYWELLHLRTGESVLSGSKKVDLKPGESVLQKSLDLEKQLATHGRDNVVLRIGLEIDGELVSENGVFLTQPRFAALPRAKVRIGVEMLSKTEAEISVVSPVYQHRFALDLDVLHTCDDNYFDLFPGHKRFIRMSLSKPMTAAKLKKSLRWFSLATLMA